MNRAQKFLQNESGQQFRTKSREGMQGSRHARNLVENALKQVNFMLDPNHPSPCPATVEDANLLRKAAGVLEGCIGDLKRIKETKKRMKY